IPAAAGHGRGRRHQRQLWAGVAARHCRCRARCRGLARLDESARRARYLWPPLASQRDSLCRRDCRGSLVCDGAGQGSEPCGHSARPAVARCKFAGGGSAAQCAGRFVSMSGARRKRDLVLALSGGVGGAKLALGLSRLVPSDRLIVVANTGDDFEHLGLYVSPDVDTLLYTLAGLNNPETGWGRRDETWTFMAALQALGGETWFRLGDGDLAMHVERTRRLKSGEPLSRIVAGFARLLGISARIVPMTDAPVRTRVQTRDGWLAFQRYFVE